MVSEPGVAFEGDGGGSRQKLMMMGVFATVNDVIDFDTASLVAMEFHAKVEKEVVVTIEERIIDLQRRRRQQSCPARRRSSP